MDRCRNFVSHSGRDGRDSPRPRIRFGGHSTAPFRAEREGIKNWKSPRLSISPRLRDRKQLPDSLDRIRRDADAAARWARMDTSFRATLEMLPAQGPKGIDIATSPNRTRTLQETGRQIPLFTSDCNWDWQASSAPRLVEAGVPFVSSQAVSSHAIPNPARSSKGSGSLLPLYDRCIAP